MGTPLALLRLQTEISTLDTGMENSQEAKVNLPLISLYDSTASLRTEGRCSQFQTGVKRKMTGTRNTWGFGPMLGTFYHLYKRGKPNIIYFS